MKLATFTKPKTALIVLSALVGSTTANAALPTEAADAMTAIGTLITDFIAAGWPIVVSLVVGVIGIKLFKKFSQKVS
ncbi:major coat protein [Aliivibrio fischeri]|uniref:major coat protein n=1 Tax=Aliivibrio fischeri TaxID=668 RepID=UPI0012D97D02|nr:major coat protein [Aliivibrio fischeri]MCE7534842.1 phage coat protein [Aliivibrio fischeri]MCE7557322.1 phage coat protein [Aliivibrio fischeri]MCE7566965.1 phage coat protein [Aliivibrio fischeri]MUH97365.1 phage coat protein [Aliivibrio fischeri]MUI64978.1 phage coat protein [Aliivibrio fischeri]